MITTTQRYVCSVSATAQKQMTPDLLMRLRQTTTGDSDEFLSGARIRLRQQAKLTQAEFLAGTA